MPAKKKKPRFTPKKEPSLESQLNARVKQYERITREGMEKIEIRAKKGTREYLIALDYLSMAKNYYSDAGHFATNGNLILALAAYSYAHAWMDAGVRAGILDGKEDDRLFTLP